MITQQDKVPQEDMDKFIQAIALLVEEEKGWKMGEFKVRLQVMDTDKQMGRFFVMHIDDARALERRRTRGVMGFMPSEFTAIVNMQTWKAYVGKYPDETPWIPKPEQETPGRPHEGRYCRDMYLLISSGNPILGRPLYRAISLSNNSVAVGDAAHNQLLQGFVFKSL